MLLRLMVARWIIKNEGFEINGLPIALIIDCDVYSSL